MDNLQRIDLFTEEGVVLLHWNTNCTAFNHRLGKFIIAEYVNSQGSRFIEWIPNEVTVDTENCDHDEWSMVNATSNRPKILAEQTFKLNIKAIGYFQVSLKRNRLTFFSRENSLLADLLFQYGDAEKTITTFRTIIPTTRRDRFTYDIIDVSDGNAELLILRKSFYELNLFPESEDRFDRQFFRDLRDNPYEATMSAFSKITNFVFSPKYETRPEIDDIDLTNVENGKPCDHTPLSDEYEMISTSPKLPPVIEVYRSDPLTKEKWQNLQNADGQFLEIDKIKQLIFRGGIDTEIRHEAWKFLLEYYDWNSTYEEREKLRQKKLVEYELMKTQWETISQIQEDNNSPFKDRKTLIDKDVIRTDRFEDFFAGDDNPNLVKLRNILMTYVMYNFDVGYAQGMNDCLVPILFNLEDEIDSFWCFVGFMNKINDNFSNNIDGILEQIKQLRTLLGYMYPDFMTYLKRKNADNLFFCFRWLLVWFKRELSLSDVMLLWEVLWTGLPCRNFHLLICLALLTKEKDCIMANNYDFGTTLKHINDLSNKIDVEEVLKMAEAIYYQLLGAKGITDDIRRIIGLLPDEELCSEPNSVCEAKEQDSDLLEGNCNRGLELFFV